jgi:hypothetical protein
MENLGLSMFSPKDLSGLMLEFHALLENVTQVLYK